MIRFLCSLVLISLLGSIGAYADQPTKKADLKREIKTALTDVRKELDLEIWPRDVFAMIRGEVKSPVRGWELVKPLDLVYRYEGSLDTDEYVWTFKKGAEKRYFHTLETNGVDPESGQSVSEIRVKRVKHPDDNWRHNDSDDRGVWNKDHTVQFIPFEDEKTSGFCWHHRTTGFGPTTQEECFKPAEVIYK